MAIASLALFLTAATTSVVPPPPQQRLAQWKAGPVRCGGTVIDPVRLVRSRPELAWAEVPLKMTTLRFRIDASGRPLSIKREGGGDYIPFGSDLIPAFAASQFASGSPRNDCAIDFTIELAPLAMADRTDLMAYSLDQSSGQLPPEGWDRITPPDTDCRRRPHPAELLRAYPDFEKLPGTPGERQWSMTGYDLDKKGRPINVQTVAGTGDAALDAASRKAVAKSRFVAGARTGCMYPYWRGPLRIAAPPAPSEDSFGPTPHCPAAPWVQQPRMNYPQPWNRRSIEGWAVVQFDVAPWGEVGNTRVLASEPAEDFGREAMQVVRTARRAPSTTGASGCIERVRFAIRPPEAAASADVPPPPPVVTR